MNEVIDPLSADFARRFPDSFARVLAHAGDEADAVVRALPASTAAAVVTRLPAPRIEAMLAGGGHEPERWLAEASFEDAVALLSRMPRESRLTLVNSLRDRERRQQLLRHQQYPAHSVGALVGDIPQRLSIDSPIAEILLELREIGGSVPVPLVVVDHQGRYQGVLNTWRLLSRDRPTGTVATYVDRVSPLSPETSIANAAENQQWDQLGWLPVVDGRGRVLGAVSRAAILKAARLQAGGALGAGDLTLELLRDAVYVLGNLLDAVLMRNRRS